MVQHERIFPDGGSSLPEESFRNQFDRKEYVKVGGGSVEIVDIVPERAKTEVPVLMAPGWSQTAEVYRPAIQTLVEKERRVVSLNHPRWGAASDSIPEKAAAQYPGEEVRKAFNILGVLDEKGIEKTDVVAHSEAAVNVSIAAVLHPEKFRNIVFVAPAGMIGTDTFTRLLQGFAGQAKGRPESMEGIAITETEKQIMKTAALEAIKYIAKNPVRAFREGKNIAESQIHDMLRYLHEKGIGIVVMSGVDDPIFPMGRMQEIAKADMLDGFLSVKGGHGAIGEHPELFMAAAEEMLTAVEEKKKKEHAA